MTHGDRPLYLRLREALTAALLEGRYADGDPLPSVRALAAKHGLNPLTVAKAYQAFQDDGVVGVRRGVGMFVMPGASARLRATERGRFLTEEWPQIAARMKRLGIEPDELLERERV